MTKMGGVSCRKRNGIVGEHITDVERYPGNFIRRAAVITHPDRAPAYQLGTLDHTRAAFTQATGLPVFWEGGGEAEVP